MSDKKRILLVDDDVDLLTQTASALERAGFQVDCAQSHEEAEELLLGPPPDLAILDLMMEQTDSGFVLCHQLKTLHPRTPVIIMTGVTAACGLDFPVTSGAARAWLEADRMLDKPVPWGRLQSEIETLLAGV